MRPRLRRLRGRALRIAGGLFLLGLVTLAVAAPASYVFVHETTQPEFCNSCHIMEPFYQSWMDSAHRDVGCVECHYEPGAVETLEGKFAALSQLAKYVTRTQGTKPWAEVGDASCMRSGCHDLRGLEGEIAFGSVRFDHGQHLLESHQGRHLRCVTCHAQILQDEHISVSESVCFTCHFMPTDGGVPAAATSDCETCHVPPADVLDVAGRPFDHGEYLARGVDCRDCHARAVEGTGVVRTQRCKSCHGEPEYLERIADAGFLHEVHVQANKVECFECHDEIHHGLRVAAAHEPTDERSCASCHEGPHGAASLLYAGTGAAGVADRPSRMFETGVACEACHTGRAAHLAARSASARAGGGAAHGAMAGSAVAEAGNLDCVHCHGPGYDGMLGDWQACVGEELERLGPLLDELAAALPGGDAQHPARAPFLEARQNLDLVRRDGSRGAHNPTYAIEALAAGARRIDRAFELLGVERAAPVAAGVPRTSKDGCSSCHLGVGEADAGGRAFPHRPHVAAAGLDCAACHSVEHHGAPAPGREDCSTCHHREREELDVADCAACHGVQDDLLRGELAALADPQAVMGELECSECHGDPPDVLVPGPQLCVLCHEDGYDAMHLAWRDTVAAELERLVPRLTELERAAGASAEASELLRRARADVEVVVHDGSRGVHNPDGALTLLRAAAERLDRAGDLVGVEGAPPLAAGAPFRSAVGCSTCHLGLERDGGAGAFPHGRHLVAAGLDCDACHAVEPHGEPAFDRADCAGCHHRESPDLDFDPWECSDCHAPQDRFVAGDLTALGGLAGRAGLDDPPAPMADKECTDCHGEPPDVLQPNPVLCGLCHDETYPPMLEEWRATTGALADELRTALEAAGPDADGEDVARARRALEVFGLDASHGAHNPELATGLLRAALEALRAD